MESLMNYSLDEVVIYPATTSHIRHRSYCDAWSPNRQLPVFVAPMTSISSPEVYDIYSTMGFNPIIPRTTEFKKPSDSKWRAVSLKQCYQLLQYLKSTDVLSICIDVANGHMQEVIDVATAFKSKAPHSQLMVGNIANPQVIVDYAEAGVDYLRVGIGGGSVCSTAVKTGIFMSHVNFIVRAREIISQLPCFSTPPKLIADGGINRGNMIKALALGYDYVMLGREFARCEDIPGYTIINDSKVRDYYGMSTKRASTLIGKQVVSYEEGIESKVVVDTNLNEFRSEFISALQSTMSYTASGNLKEFIGKVGWGIMSEHQRMLITK